MNRDTAALFSFYKGLDLEHYDVLVEPEFDESADSLKEILDEIFSVDPKSGFPNGDLAYWLSPEGNPNVKTWLENNLLRPRVSSNRTMEGVTDDMIEEFSRRPDESVSEYSIRLNDLYTSAKENYLKLTKEE